jgi:hypothetical protein
MSVEIQGWGKPSPDINHHYFNKPVNCYKKNMRYTKFLLIVSLVFVFFGCNNSNHLGTVLVNGTVQVDGQAVEGIEVVFSPASGDGLPAYGQTDKDGRYSLTTAGTEIGAGAVPGEFVPVFTKVSAEHDPRFIGKEDVIPPPPKITHLIPERYSSKTTTDIPAVVVAKGKSNVFNFELSSKSK